MEEEIIEEKKETQKKKVKEKKPKIDKEKEHLKQVNQELNDKILRISAEMQNMRRRYDLDISNLHKYDGFEFASSLLPIIDNFERALSIKQSGTEKFLEGFKMIYDNLIELLKAKGVVEIEALDNEFNPNFMNAITTDFDDARDDNVVLEVLQKGYKYNDRLLRPAMVKVNNRKEKNEE